MRPHKRVKDMQVGDELTCTRHGGKVLLSPRMLREQRRICDACISQYGVDWLRNATRDRTEAYAAQCAESLKQGADHEWRPLPGFPGYFASSGGLIRSDGHKNVRGPGSYKRVLAVFTGKRGYQSVALAVEGRSKTMSVHSLVALAFIGPRPPGKDVAHGDGNPGNNRADNLRYATHAENEADKALHGTKPLLLGERCGSAKLSTADVLAIKARLQNGESQRVIASAYGVDQSAISNIKRGRNWRHLTEGGSSVEKVAL